MKRALRWASIGLAALMLVGAVAYLQDMNRAYSRVEGKSTVLSSRYGDIEYREGGSGPAVLVIHGGGGGYDQGELLAHAMLGDSFHWVAPSRFGYLRSALPPSATWDDQAHAYALLLDHLGIPKVAVVAMSQGGPSALLFAALHPERVGSLACLSCGVAASVSAQQAGANRKGDLLKMIFRYDIGYWAVSKLFRTQFLHIMGVSKDVVASLTPGQREIAGQFIDEMSPVSRRSAGAAFDNEATLPGERIAGITAPILLVHAKDDSLQLYANAEFAASTIPGARLIHFETGGHLVAVVEQDAIRSALRKHILDHADTLAIR